MPLGVEDVVVIVKVEVTVPLEGRVGLLGLKLHVMVGSLDGLEAVRLTGPENPLTLVNVITDWPGAPISNVRDDWLVPILKSPTVTLIVIW